MKPESHPWLRLCLAICLLGGCGVATAGEGSSAGVVPAKAASQSRSQAGGKVAALKMAVPLSREERDARDWVLAACRGKSGWKTPTVLKGRKLFPLKLRAAALAALRKSLDIKRSRVSEQIAKDALLESRAVFDPVFTFSWSFSESKKYRREEMTKKFHKATQKFDIDGDGVDENILFLPESAQEQAGIRALEFRDARSAHYGWDEVTASQESDNDPDRTRSYNLSVAQVLPWGPQMSLGLVLSDHDTFFDSDGNKYDRPWTAAVSASAWIPLPKTKGFGPYAASHTTIRLQDIASRRSLWQVRLMINATLLRVDSAYWNLVASLQQLQATIQSRKTLERLLADTEKLIQAKRATPYGRYQIQVGLSRMRALEELYWQAYITASNELTRILDQREPVVFLPAGYTQLLAAKVETKVDDPVAAAMRERPLMHLGRLGVDYAQVSKLYARIEARPDLSWTTSYTRGELGTVFGYLRVKDALRKLGDMDKRIISQSLTYNLPWRNWLYRAQYRVAKSQYRQADFIRQDYRNQVETEVLNALAQLQSSKARLKVAMENLKLAKEAFDAANKLRAVGRLTEFEIVSKNDAVLQAEFSRIQAQIDQRLATSLFLYAVGRIARRYGQMTARNRLDRHRLELLAQAGGLRFFGAAGSGRAR